MGIYLNGAGLKPFTKNFTMLGFFSNLKSIGPFLYITEPFKYCLCYISTFLTPFYT